MSTAPRTGFLGREPIFTPDGLVPIHALRAGDLVLGRSVADGGTAAAPVRVLEAHLLSDTPIGAFDVGEYAEPDAAPPSVLTGDRQTFWIPEQARWIWDFSYNSDEPACADGGQRVAYGSDRTVWTSAAAGIAWLEAYPGSDDGTTLTLDALGVAARTLGAMPVDDGSHHQLRWPTHHLTLDGADGFYATTHGLLARDFTGGAVPAEGARD